MTHKWGCLCRKMEIKVRVNCLAFRVNMLWSFRFLIKSVKTETNGIEMINSGVTRAHSRPPIPGYADMVYCPLIKAPNKGLNSLVLALLFYPCKAQHKTWGVGGFSEAALVFRNDSALLEAQITTDWTHRSPLIPPSRPHAAALQKPGLAPGDRAGSHHPSPRRRLTHICKWGWVGFYGIRI